MEMFDAIVKRKIYRNNNNGFSVYSCHRTDDNKKDVVIRGTFPVELCPDTVTYRFTGSYENHPVHGWQYHIIKYEEQLPTTITGIRNFLCSTYIKGIGKALAGRIVEKFGLDTIQVIDNEPERLLEVNGIGRKKLERILSSWQTNREMQNILSFLKEYELSDALALKIYHAYGTQSMEILHHNPYKLAEDIEGVGFKIADMVAKRMGFHADDYLRIRCGILYTLKKACENGHCFLYREQLVKESQKILYIHESKIYMTLDDMANREIRERTDIVTVDLASEGLSDSECSEYITYPSYYYYAEIGCARELERLTVNEYRRMFSESCQMDEDAFRHQYADIDDTLNLDQWDAVYTARYNSITILTGGPGTGKTHTIKKMVTLFENMGMRVLLAAPTGRAAKRMSEQANHEAKTIHRMLEYSPKDGYKRNKDNKLDGDVLIVDECSMIDILLMYHLLKAVPNNMKIVFVGDADQLPSVGSGNVFHDLIDSEQFPVIRLTEVFRQSEGSGIVALAHRVNEGGYLNLDEISNGVTFIDVDKVAIPVTDSQNLFDKAQTDTASKTAYIIEYLVTKKIPSLGYSQQDIQVLSPQRKSDAGTIELNRRLQNALNHNTQELKYITTMFRLGDKVMQIENNYEKGVFNGDIGQIIKVDMEDKYLQVEFDKDMIIQYEQEELEELTHAYAVTIHKSQGCEYPVVVVPIIKTFYAMLKRNLLYTGITRAKEHLYIIGTKSAMIMAVNNSDVGKRNTLLSKRIQRIGNKRKISEFY